MRLFKIILILGVILTIATVAPSYFYSKHQAAMLLQQTITEHLSVYSELGMTGLKISSKECFERAETEPDWLPNCMAIDYLGQKIDHALAQDADFPEDEYFNNLSVLKRINTSSATKNLDAKEINKMISRVNKEVDYNINKSN